MKIQIRTGLFETNSSSTHSLVMCMKKDWNAFTRGNRVYDRWDEKLININEMNPEDEEEKRYATYDEFTDDEYLEYFEDEFTTPSGETVVAFGHYGYDG